MGNIGTNNSEDTRIQGLLGTFLAASVDAGNSSSGSASHLDQDTLSAFVEGNLNERQATPAVTHLASCSYCRHITTALVRLDLAFAEEAVPAVQEAAEPSRVSEVLNSILTRIFGARDGSAVFAHNESDDKESSDKDKSDDPNHEAEK